MAWCEAQGVTSILGLAKNSRLRAQVQAELAQAQAQFAQPGQPARVCTEGRYGPRDSGPQERRGGAQAAHLDKGSHPRWVVTAWPSTPWTAQTGDEQLSCARGAMENRRKAQQLARCADRPRTAPRWSKHIRWSCSSFAYLLRQALRRLGRHGTEMAHAQCGTLRLRRRKIGALRTGNARRIGGALASGYPYVTLLQPVYTQVRCGQKRPLAALLFASQANVSRNGQPMCVRRRCEGTKPGRLASAHGSVHPSSSPF